MRDLARLMKAMSALMKHTKGGKAREKQEKVRLLFLNELGFVFSRLCGSAYFVQLIFLGFVLFFSKRQPPKVELHEDNEWNEI